MIDNTYARWNVVLSDQNAADHLLVRGRKVTAPRSLSLTMNEVGDSTLRVADLRTSQHSERLESEVADSFAYRILYVLSGRINIREGTKLHSVSDGEFRFIKNSAAMTLDVLASTERHEIFVGRHTELPYPPLWDELSARTTADIPAAQILLASSRSALTSRVDPDVPGWRGVRAGILSLTGALVEALSPVDTPEGELVRAAQWIIREQARDPELTVAVIAQKLHTSARNLLRAFNEIGTTTQRELTKERVRMASHLLAVNLSAERYPIAIVASTTGFSSVDAMRRALRQYQNQDAAREETTAPPPNALD